MMKKTFLTLFLMTTMFGAAYADGREKPTSVDKLPQAAQEFLSAHFKDLTVAYAVEEQKYTGKEYEVVYTDRTEIEFRSDGQWESVGRKYSPVPASIVPQPIQTFVSGSNYPGQFIRQIDRNAYTWEVELSNGLEIKFDNQFNVIDIDD
jgi:hypothetical protein